MADMGHETRMAQSLIDMEKEDEISHYQPIRRTIFNEFLTHFLFGGFEPYVKKMKLIGQK